MTTANEKESRSVENFLKAVYVLQQQSATDETVNEEKRGRVATNALAEALNISPPSVTDMARRMVESDLVDYRKYYGVRLTGAGREVALHVIRRHRLIELYLSEELGYDLHEVHDEAEELEHAVSDRFIEAIAAKLGHPTTDPHGDPIPSAEGVIIRRDDIPLTQLTRHTPARVSRFTVEDSAMLQHITSRHFTLGTVIQIIERDPFDGPITAMIAGERSVIGYNVAACILVEVLPAQEADEPG